MWDAIRQRHEALRAFIEREQPEYRVVEIMERTHCEFEPMPDALPAQPYTQTHLESTYSVKAEHAVHRTYTAEFEVMMASDGTFHLMERSYRVGY